MNKIRQYIFNNFHFLLLSISLVAGAIVPFPFGKEIYMAGLLGILCYSLKNTSNNWYLGRYYILFLIACFLSCIVSNTYDIRYFVFVLILISFTPITNSTKLFNFRKKYLKHCLMIFPFLSIISLVCYILDINYYAHIRNELDFSALFPHSMWLGAAVGLSNIVTLWWMFRTKNRVGQIIILGILLLSIYVSVVAASRSALFASLISMCLFIVVTINNIKKLLLFVCIITVATIFILPFYLSGAERMKRKFEASKGKYGSRTELITTGFKHFDESPIFGIGFAVTYNVKGEKKVGSVESGSGWLSIIFQTGITGFSVMFIIILNLYKIFRYMRFDDELLLFVFAFTYFCLHSVFEGYILTVGYYPCILFWSLLGYLYAYPYYKEGETYKNTIKNM